MRTTQFYHHVEFIKTQTIEMIEMIENYPFPKLSIDQETLMNKNGND